MLSDPKIITFTSNTYFHHVYVCYLTHKSLSRARKVDEEFASEIAMTELLMEKFSVVDC